jgi:hypothetical protein
VELVQKEACSAGTWAPAPRWTTKAGKRTAGDEGEWMTAATATYMVRRFLLGFALTAVLLLAAGQGPSAEGPVSGPPAPEGSPQRLIEDHDCWTGEAPPGMRNRVPGHAVVTWPGDAEATYGGRGTVAAALGHVFEGEHPDLLVHAFCR